MNIKKCCLGCIGAVIIFVVIVWMFPPVDNGPGDPGDVIAKGDRQLGIAVSQASDNDFGKAYAAAKRAGIDFVPFSQQWDQIETSPGVYANDYFAIVNSFYPGDNMKVAIDVNPFDTNNDRRPTDLKGKPMNDSTVITRYNNMITWVFSQIPDVNLVCFGIGNEIDVYLGINQTRYEEYAQFFQSTSAHVRSLRTGLKVGTKATFGGLIATATKTFLQNINVHSDAVLVTYYPLNPDFTIKDPNVTVQVDFQAICDLYSGKLIYFMEAGLPTSSKLGSSENKQAIFVQQVFREWDNHSEQIKVISFLWLHDPSENELATYETYYGLSDPNFLAYLGTLGLRTNAGVDKQGFKTLVAEANARGWAAK